MTGHTALVVGGTSGIGLATARLLRAAGATVHIAGRTHGAAHRCRTAERTRGL